MNKQHSLPAVRLKILLLHWQNFKLTRPTVTQCENTTPDRRGDQRSRRSLKKNFSFQRSTTAGRDWRMDNGENICLSSEKCRTQSDPVAQVTD
ncbi:hypothetical protein T09_12837 [Trichinella sp. T9]|nr:hypothetical protein T09_12837 [Trichinella sp. T9]